METIVSTPTATASEAPLSRGRPADPCVLVIFGASGDLTKRLLIPSLYNLARNNLLPQDFVVIGAARSGATHEDFRSQVRSAIHESTRVGTIDPVIWEKLEKRLYYVQLTYDEPDGYAELAELLARCDQEHHTRNNYLFYLATPPTVFAEVAIQLGEAKLAQERHDDCGGWRRIVVEKPFGHDLESARALNRAIQQYFAEHQVYRIDHYLGKETVQNVLVFRFANSMLEPIWNRSYIDHVQITVTETVGVEMRGRYFDQVGLVRDMMQNHMLQLLALVAMEPPYSFESDAVQDEKAKVLHAIRPLTHEEVFTHAVRGQYGAGRVNGTRLPAYRDEPHVAPDSITETYAALKLRIDNWRWADVPFYLRSGKALPERLTEIVIQFRQAPHIVFRNRVIDQVHPNRLVLHIQPREGISWQFEAKVPGPSLRMKTVSMDFDYHNFFGADPNTGYETLLYDAMNGDATLFQRDDFIESSWARVMPILDVWHNVPARDFPNYPARQSWGPPAADELMHRDGRAWRQP